MLNFGSGFEAFSGCGVVVGFESKAEAEAKAKADDCTCICGGMVLFLLVLHRALAASRCFSLYLSSSRCCSANFLFMS
jgi:hypothetical protein